MSAFTLFLLFIYFNPGAALVFQFMNFIEFRLQSNFDTYSNGLASFWNLIQTDVIAYSVCRNFSPCSSRGCAHSISFYQYS